MRLDISEYPRDVSEYPHDDETSLLPDPYFGKGSSGHKILSLFVLTS